MTRTAATPQALLHMRRYARWIGIALTFTTTMTKADVPEPIILPLWPDTAPGALHDVDTQERVEDTRHRNVHAPELTLYPPTPESANGITVLIFPGGGYEHLSMKYEGSDVALRFREGGFLAGVVKYRIKPYHHPIPLMDAARAFELVRERAVDLGADPDRIGVLGFSAGGHLAATLSVLTGQPGVLPDGQVLPETSKPAFAVLVYPVVTMIDGITSQGSRSTLLGERPTPETIALLSADQQVDATSPPMFLIHSVLDHVSVENSDRLHQALLDAGVRTGYMRLDVGGHGFGLGGDDPLISTWPDEAMDWILATLDTRSPTH